MNTNLNLYQINTTAWEEEDFLLMTSLTEEQITKVITPIVKLERENDTEYDNDFLVRELERAYPKATVIHCKIDLISI
jgi:hypothetical protein